MLIVAESCVVAVISRDVAVISRDVAVISRDVAIFSRVPCAVLWSCSTAA